MTMTFDTTDTDVLLLPECFLGADTELFDDDLLPSAAKRRAKEEDDKGRLAKAPAKG